MSPSTGLHYFWLIPRLLKIIYLRKSKIRRAGWRDGSVIMNTVLADDQGSILSSHMVANKLSSTSVPEASNTLHWPLWALHDRGVSTHMQSIHPYTENKIFLKNSSSNNKKKRKEWFAHWCTAQLNKDCRLFLNCVVNMPCLTWNTLSDTCSRVVDSTFVSTVSDCSVPGTVNHTVSVVLFLCRRDSQVTNQ